MEKNTDLEQMADNTQNITDQFLYTGFVDQDLENETGLGTYDFGETLVMLAPLGTFKGYANGSAIDETIDNDALDAIIAAYTGVELLLDVDHKSMRNVEERDTTAAGWIYDLTAVKDLGRVSGLYGRVKWTDIGRKLIETRQYRFISPVFEIENGKPTKLINAALTNRPAMDTIAPILNSEPEKDDVEMTKDEIIDLIKTTIEGMKSETVENGCSDKDDEKTVENTETVEEVKEEVVEDKEEEKVEEPVEEKEDEEVKEVIKEEVLNSAPSTIGTDITSNEWQNLHGEAFWKYLNTHKDLM